LRSFSFKSFLAFIRFKVSLAVTFSAYASGLICRRGFSLLDLLPFSGIFLLAAGASALNQYQEKEWDSRMERTKKRPLPSSEITTTASLWLSVLLIVSGSALIACSGHMITLILGIFTVLWYNGLYTYLKRKSAFAVVPGALTGAVPILMGWTASGGYLFHPFPLYLAFFIFLWQVPHFWLLTLFHESDYRNAGFPVLSDLFTVNRMKKIIFTWLIAASLSSLLMVLFGVVRHNATAIFILVMNSLLLFFSAFYLFMSEPPRYRLLFLLVNIFMLLVFCMIIADNIFPGGL
jgi:heme o synthase